MWYTAQRIPNFDSRQMTSIKDVSVNLNVNHGCMPASTYYWVWGTSPFPESVRVNRFYADAITKFSRLDNNVCYSKLWNKLVISKLAFPSVSKRVLVHNLSYGKSSTCHKTTHFHVKSFAPRFVLRKRWKVIRKWLIVITAAFQCTEHKAENKNLQ